MGGLIGARIPRLEDGALLVGKGRFIDDIMLAGVLHAAFVRSPHPHAAIRGVDARDALALPGVLAVLTLDDLAPVLAKRRMLRHSNSGTPLERYWSFALADGETSYVGEAVALVLAVNRYAAEDAAALVAVDYDVLPSVADCRAAVAPAAPAVRRELNTNVAAIYKVAFGDAQAAFNKAAHVFHEELWQHRGAAHPIEGRGILAQWRDGMMTVWASTQKAHDLFQSLTALLDFDESRLRVATPDVGGGFGPKLCVYPEDIAVVAAAKLLGRSIKWIEDRREHFTNAAQERDQYWSIDIAVDADARLLGVRGKLIHDLGAYALQDVNIPFNSASMMSGPICAAGHCRSTSRSPPPTRRRCRRCAARDIRRPRSPWNAHGPGRARIAPGARRSAPPQSDPGGEDALHQAAQGALRRQHAVRQRGLSVVQATGVAGPRGGTTSRSGQAAARRERRYIGHRARPRHQGHGTWPVRVRAGAGVEYRARVGFTGAAAIGQGLGTALAQICAGELGLRAADITVVPGDTSGVSLGLGAFASRQTVTAGSSVLLAARAGGGEGEKAREPRAGGGRARSRDCEWRVRVVGAPQLAVKFGELAAILKGAPGYGFPSDIEPGLEANVNWRSDSLAYANACHVAEVEVDPIPGDQDPELRCAAGLGNSDQSHDGRWPGPRRRGATASATRSWSGWDSTRADSPPPRHSPTTCCRRHGSACDRRPSTRNAVAAQSARRQGRGLSQHHPDRGGGHLRHRGCRCNPSGSASRKHQSRRKSWSSSLPMA
jgi:carbon-monoxide dehydrogenase large subunit